MRTALTGRTHGCTDQYCKREEIPCQLGAVYTWHICDMLSLSQLVRNSRLCCKTHRWRGLVRFGESVRAGALFVCRHLRGDRQRDSISTRTRLTQRRRLALGGGRSRYLRAFQVLGGGDEQNLVAGAAKPSAAAGRASGCASCVQTAFDFLALSARLLEGLGVGQRADALAHLLVDVSRDLAHGPIVHWGFSGQTEQSLLRAGNRGCGLVDIAG